MPNRIERREDLMKNHADEDRRVREALERQSPRTSKVNMVATLNALGAIHGAKEAPPITALNAIRKAQSLAARSASAHNRAHDAFQRSESFDRLFPR